MSSISAAAATIAPTRSGRSRRLKLGGVFSALGAAQRAALALESNRRPSAADLRILGIAPDAFDRQR